MSQGLIGKTVLVTGSSGGVGMALVGHLADLGWTVFAGVRSFEAGRHLAAGRNNVVLVELDVCAAESIAKARDEISNHLGGVGLFGLVNNAGLSSDGPLELVAVQALRRQFNVNVIGAIAVTQAFLPLLRRCQGRIINVGGGAGRLTLPMYGALSASKAALDSVTNSFRMELKFQGVGVTYIEPGSLDTPFFKKSAEAARVDGLSLNDETKLIYQDAIDAVNKAFAKSRPEPVKVIVNVITKALTSRNLRPRYIVGKENKMHLFLLPKLSVTLRDRILMSALGIKQDLFKQNLPA